MWLQNTFEFLSLTQAGFTAAMLAAKAHNWDIVEYLVSEGADILFKVFYFSAFPFFPPKHAGPGLQSSVSL